MSGPVILELADREQHPPHGDVLVAGRPGRLRAMIVGPRGLSILTDDQVVLGLPWSSLTMDELHAVHAQLVEHLHDRGPAGSLDTTDLLEHRSWRGGGL